jgi:polyisoprenoid-binding protein YceI
MMTQMKQNLAPAPTIAAPDKLIRKRPWAGAARLPRFASVFTIAWFAAGSLHAEPAYAAKSGKITFTVGSNVPLLKVSGTSSAITGQGEGTVNGATVMVRNLRFEVDPTTFKTGMKIRDQHLYEKVFTASNGSVPKIVLQAEQFQAALNAQTSKWEGELNGQLTLRGVTKPVRFTATAEKKGDTAIINARGTVKTSDFGVKVISYAGAQVHDEVSVTVSDVVMAPSNL